MSSRGSASSRSATRASVEPIASAAPEARGRESTVRIAPAQRQQEQKRNGREERLVELRNDEEHRVRSRKCVLLAAAKACRNPRRPPSVRRRFRGARMTVSSRCRRRHRPDAADPPPRRIRGDRLHDPRQGRVHEPGRVGQGPRRARDHQRRGRARRPSPGRRHRRGHRGQHRDRHRDGGGRARLPVRHRHPRHPVAGKEGHAAPRRRRADRSARGPLRQSQQLRALFGPPGRGAGEDRAGRRGLGEPVRQRRQPARALRDDRSGDLRRPRRKDRRLRQRCRHRRDAGGRRHGAQGAQPRHQDRARRSRWGRRSIPIIRPAS